MSELIETAITAYIKKTYPDSASGSDSDERPAVAQQAG
jgi:hypothetical protein